MIFVLLYNLVETGHLEFEISNLKNSGNSYFYFAGKLLISAYIDGYTSGGVEGTLFTIPKKFGNFNIDNTFIHAYAYSSNKTYKCICENNKIIIKERFDTGILIRIIN